MWFRAAIIASVLAMGGCASTTTPPPEPDMSNLVNVNKEVPPNLNGYVLDEAEGQEGE